MSTNIIQTNGNILTTIPDYEIIDDAASIIYVGKNVLSYGSYIQSGITRIMENFAGNVYPNKPLVGQLWYKTQDSTGATLNKLFLYLDNTSLSSDGWIELADQRDIANLQSEINNLSSQIGQNNSNLQQEIDTINGEISTINGQISTINGEISTINGEIANIDAEIAGLQGDVGNLQNEINAINTNNSAYATKDWSNSTFVTKNNSSPDTNSYSGDLGSSGSKYNNIFATTFNGIALESYFGDVAERYESDKEYDVGTIVKIGGEKEVTSTTSYCDPQVFGVVSENPGYLMNCSAGDNKTHPPIVLMGRSKVKVTGLIKKGDFIVTSTINGVGVSINLVKLDLSTINGLCIVGRALEDYNSSDIGTIDCFIGK